jgi:uncharacterized membrane protein
MYFTRPIDPTPFFFPATRFRRTGTFVAALLGATALMPVNRCLAADATVIQATAPIFFSQPGATGTTAIHVSGDGTAVLGDSEMSVAGNPVPQGFVVTNGGAGPQTALPYLNAGIAPLADHASVAYDINQNGTVAVGYQTSSISGFTNGSSTTAAAQAMVWTVSSGGAITASALPTPAAPAGGSIISLAYGVSANGNIVVGVVEAADSNDNGLYGNAAIWNRQTNTAPTQINLVPAGIGTTAQPSYGFATAVSGDGTTAAGFALDFNASTLAQAVQGWRYNIATNVASLLPGINTTDNVVIPLRANSDGSVIVGVGLVGAVPAQGNPILQAFRWTNTGGLGMTVSLGSLSGPSGVSAAFGVSGNGNVVVGGSSSSPSLDPLKVLNVLYDPANFNFSTFTAFRWTQATGMQNLNTLLANAGVNMTGINLQFASDVSTDGKIIVGTGTKNSGANQAFVVRYIDASTTSSSSGSSSSGSSSSGSSSSGSSSSGSSTIAGISTYSAMQNSLNQLGDARQTWEMHGNAFAAPLLGDNSPIKSGGQADAFATVGSAAGGSAGKQSFGGGLSLFAGLSYAAADLPYVNITNALFAAGKLQYVYDGAGAVRPFAEIGGWLSTSSLAFSRSYANGAGVSTGIGNTNGVVDYVFGRFGMAFDLSPKDQFALNGEVGFENANTNAYGEALTAGNPFNATVSQGSDRMGVAKLRAQWTHDWTQELDTTLWLAGAQAFNYSTDVTASIPGFGVLNPVVSNPAWVEYGVRVGYRINDVLTVNAFADGLSGDHGAGTRVHGGGGFILRF